MSVTPPVEYAPEYTPAQRLRIVVLGLVAGALVLAVCQFWLFPLLRAFAPAAHCRTVFGFSGVAVLFRGVFVGLPLSSALLVAVLLGRRGMKVLREGRVPPSGEKVFRRTPIVRGVKAKALGWVQLLAAVPLLALAVWGVFQAQAMVAQAQRHPVRCAPAVSQLGALAAPPGVTRQGAGWESTPRAFIAESAWRQLLRPVLPCVLPSAAGRHQPQAAFTSM